MTYTLTVLRRRKGEDRSYAQSFALTSEADTDTVASALTELNSRETLVDIDGEPADKIDWECSCLQKKCGACAMVINGRPRLACDARLSELGTSEITVEPLRKFPVISDLIVDRSILMENLRRMKLWLREDSGLPDVYRELAYEASGCIQCGCCLEICPNFYAGGDFYGMAAVPVTTRLLTEMPVKIRREVAGEYSKHVFAGCGKSLSCKDVCPRHIDTEGLLVNSNAMAIWRKR